MEDAIGYALTAGEVLMQQGQPGESVYLSLSGRLRSGDHPRVATNLNNLGQVLVEQRRYDEARPLLEASLTMYRELFDANYFEQAAPMLGLGRLHTAGGRFSEAERLLTDALRLQEAHFGPDHRRLEPTREALAELDEAKRAASDE